MATKGDEPKKNTFFISTSIPYTNAKPHIGNSLEFFQADAIARYHKQQGKEVFFLTGADEHGQKIEQSALAAGKAPQSYVDELAAVFQQLWKSLGIDYTKFIRTTDPYHIEAVQYMWERWVQQDDIYKSSYTGLYCVGCEEYKNDSDLVNGLCPNHNKAPEQVNEENYFFRLSKYSDQIKKLITNDTLRIVPKKRKNEILAFIDEGLKDISFSRPKSKLSWGIPVPGDPTQVMYVWPDALGNYITALGYPEGEDFKKYWPADVHVIGKDIIRFHAAFWPAMLLSLDVPLPKAIYVHGFISVNGQKISKSIGNTIDPEEAAKVYGIDALRFYLLHEIPYENDGDFNWEHFQAVYTSSLSNDFGNLVQRTAGMIIKYLDGKLHELPKVSHDETPYHRAMKEFNTVRALDEVMAKVRDLNQYIDEVRPWDQYKNGETERLDSDLHYLAASVIHLAELAWPFMPTSCEKIVKMYAHGGIDQTVGMLFPRPLKPEQQVASNPAQQQPPKK